jgi:hypothetical protein
MQSSRYLQQEVIVAYEYNGISSQRPNCWSDARYFNPNTRECRGCSFVTSCRDEITRIQNRSVSNYPYQTPAPTQQPSPMPAQQIGLPNRQVPAVQSPVNQPVISAYPAPQRYQYGWLSDPLYYTMQASPPPMRPQLEGESFMERMFKNMALDASASAVANVYWAIRQAVLAPESLPQVQQMADVSAQKDPEKK